MDQILFLTITSPYLWEGGSEDTFVCKQKQLSKRVTIKQKHLKVCILRTALQTTFLVYNVLLL